MKDGEWGLAKHAQCKVLSPKRWESEILFKEGAMGNAKPKILDRKHEKNNNKKERWVVGKEVNRREPWEWATLKPQNEGVKTENPQLGSGTWKPQASKRKP